jgi:hypothetical protein
MEEQKAEGGACERMAVTESGKASQRLALGSLCDWLQENDFRVATNNMASQENDCKWYAYRRLIDSARDCALNDKPPSLIVLPHLFSMRDRQYSSVEVEITGQVGEPWFRLKAYGIGLDELPTALPGIEAALVRAWNALATTPGSPHD